MGNLLQIGIMKIEDEKLWLSDPMYDEGVNDSPNRCYNALIPNAKTGNWVGFIVRRDFHLFGERNGVLIAIHVDHAKLDLEELRDYQQITVDSGFAGIFANQSMNDSNTLEMNDGETEASFTNAFISQSGIGDWIYQTRIAEESGKVVAIELDFTPLTREEMEPGKEDLVG